MVFVKSPNNKTLIVNLNPSATTLLSLALHIQRNHHIPISLQRLYLSPKLLSTPQNATVPLSRLGISPNSTLTLHVPILGGMRNSVPPKPELGFLHPTFVAWLAGGSTISSDFNPAHVDTDVTAAAPIWPAFGNEVDDDKDNKEAEEAEEEKNYDQNQIIFDEFEGNEAGSLSFVVYDEGEKEKEGGKDEDKEPVDDRLWELVYQRIDSLKKDRREAILKEEIRKYAASIPIITKQRRSMDAEDTQEDFWNRCNSAGQMHGEKSVEMKEDRSAKNGKN